MLQMNLQLFAHKKGVGSTKNGRDSEMVRWSRLVIFYIVSVVPEFIRERT